MAAAVSRVVQQSVFLPADDDRLYTISNEEGQDGSRKIVASSALKLVGNAFWGLSGNFILDLASYRDEITRVDVFDLSPKVARYFEGMKGILANPKLTLEEARARIGTLAAEIQGEDEVIGLARDIANNRSWLSSQERFDRIHRIFQNKCFTFTQMELGNPEQVDAFVKARKAEGSVAALVYISNAARVPTGANWHGSGGDAHARYRAFDRSLEIMILDSAVVIDAAKRNPTDKYATQTVHFPNRKRQLMPTPCECMYSKALNADDYDQVRYCTARGSNPNGIEQQRGYTYLARSIRNKQYKTAQALLDSGADVNKISFTKKNPDDKQHSTSWAALHIAAWDVEVEGVRLLLQNKASLDVRNISDLTPLELTLIPNVPLFQTMRQTNPKALLELQGMLSGKIQVDPLPARQDKKEDKKEKKID